MFINKSVIKSDKNLPRSISQVFFLLQLMMNPHTVPLSTPVSWLCGTWDTVILRNVPDVSWSGWDMSGP